MKQIDKTASNYINNLENKIVELGLKLKSTEREFENYKKDELEVFRQFSHNLINPLGNIVSFSNIILDTANDIGSEKGLKYLNIIQDSSNFSLELLNSFIDYYKLKRDSSEIEKSQFGLNSIVSDEINRIKPKSSKREISVDLKAPFQEIVITSNEGYIRKIVAAVIHNAIRFSKNNSKVLIELKENKKNIEISITDFGIGISEENLSKVFDEFFVCNTYDLDKTKCIGLGLSISKILAIKLPAKISIKSAIKKGTSVVLSFKK